MDNEFECCLKMISASYLSILNGFDNVQRYGILSIQQYALIIHVDNSLCVSVVCTLGVRAEYGGYCYPIKICIPSNYPERLPIVYLDGIPGSEVNTSASYINADLSLDYRSYAPGEHRIDHIVYQLQYLFERDPPLLLGDENAPYRHDEFVKKCIPICNISSQGRVLGSGCFGSVVLGFLNERPVALKFISIESQNRAVLHNEIITQFTLESDHILKLFAVMIGPIYLTLVMEYADENLVQFLAREGEKLSMREKLRICLDIALGLRDAHHARIIHRDLKMANILRVEGMIKISDFGLATILKGDREKEVAPEGTPSIRAPEMFMKKEYTAKADVYSFGCLMEEILSGIPIHESQHFQSVQELEERIKNGYRPTIHCDSPDAKRIIELCFKDEEQRIDSDLLVELLEEWYDSLLVDEEAHYIHITC